MDSSNTTKCGDTKIASEKRANGATYERVSVEDREVDEYCRRMPASDETSCGCWFVRGPRLRPLANKKVLVLLFSVTACIFGATHSYFNGTITTMEKRFKIPTRTVGIISIGNDVTKLVGSVLMNYYASKGHTPRWIAGGLYCSVLFCATNVMLHLAYGPGEDALRLTTEYGADYGGSSSGLNSTMTTEEFVAGLLKKQLCSEKGDEQCTAKDEMLLPVIILFIAQFVSGWGGIAIYSVGFSYLDDNIKKSKSPMLMSISFFMRMLGPAIGYGLASFSLKFYVDPTLTPTIDSKDPRWLGAWWLGWIILGAILALSATSMCLLPKYLPRAAARKELIRQKSNVSSDKEDEKNVSVADLIETVKRLLKNRVYMLNQISCIVYIFGYIPFWMYLPKFIEISYRVSASTANFLTGTVGFGFVGTGLLSSGYLVQRFRPNAKLMALWNCIVSLCTAIGVISYLALGCPEVDDAMPKTMGEFNAITDCNANCMCDFVPFQPVCSIDGKQSFISPCHAGCTNSSIMDDGSKLYSNCSCIASTNGDGNIEFGSVKSGLCPANCNKQFYAFIGVLSFLKLIISASRITNFLVSLRCVEERDKSVSLGIGLCAMSLFGLIPAPIFYGYIIDSSCLIWGKTCTGTGNCWLINSVVMRSRLIYASFTLLSIVVLFDFLIWRYIKNVNVFDDAVLEDENANNQEKKDAVVVVNKS